MNVEFSETCFSQVKWRGYDLFSVTMGLEWICKEYEGLELGFTLKMHYFWKIRK